MRCSRIRRLAAAVSAATLLWLAAAGRAQAKPALALLDFGGVGGARARAALVQGLRRRFRLVSGKAILDACDALGVAFGQGPGMAKAAARVGVVAVIGGRVTRRRLVLAVFSGRTGRVMLSRTIRWRRWPSGAHRRRALTAIMPALKRAARQGVGRPPAPKDNLNFAPEPVTASKPRPKAAQDEPLHFAPEPVKRANTSKAPVTSDQGLDDGGLSGPDDDGSSGSSRGSVAAIAPLAPPPDGGQLSKPSDDQRAGRLMASFGLGIWLRNFTLNQPSPNRTHGEYDSGPAFSLNLALRAYPAAFFTEGFAANLWLRLRFQSALGLSSQLDATNADSLSTKMWALLIDAGYNWDILQSEISPKLDISLGFGAQRFNVEWGTAAPLLADVSYSFMLIGLGVKYPFVRALGGEALSNSPFYPLSAELRFDYRLVFSAGGIEDETNGYGPATMGGLALAVGLVWTRDQMIIRAGYSYTRYFYAFSADPRARINNNQLAAGGAVDAYHALMASGGYSF